MKNDFFTAVSLYIYPSCFCIRVMPGCHNQLVLCIVSQLSRKRIETEGSLARRLDDDRKFVVGWISNNSRRRDAKGFPMYLLV